MKVLFVCRANVGRSQIAEAFFNKLSKDTAISAGTNVGENEGKKIGEHEKARFVWESMDEEGIDLRNNVRNQLTKEMSDSVDKIIFMTNKEDLPEFVDQSKVIFWDLEDPKGASYEFHVETRDKIKELVKDLIK